MANEGVRRIKAVVIAEARAQLASVVVWHTMSGTRVKIEIEAAAADGRPRETVVDVSRNVGTRKFIQCGLEEERLSVTCLSEAGACLAGRLLLQRSSALSAPTGMLA